MDLDERELYSEDEFAAQDSGSEEEAGAGASDEDGLSLGNVELEAAPRMRQPLPAAQPDAVLEGEVIQVRRWCAWKSGGEHGMRCCSCCFVMPSVRSALTWAHALAVHAKPTNDQQPLPSLLTLRLTVAALFMCNMCRCRPGLFMSSRPNISSL